MVRAGIDSVEFIAANTDAQVLAATGARTQLQLGATITRDWAPAPIRMSVARPPWKTVNACRR